MTTLADELLADLMEDGSDIDEQDEGSEFPENGDSEAPKISEMDDDDEHDEAMAEADLRDAAAAGKSAVAEAEDEEEAKARVEKINFAAVNDVRSVAGLMKSLKPVLEVSTFFLFYRLDMS